MTRKNYTLKELYSLIADTIKGTFDETYWIKAEIARMTENYSGHCYLELVEKSDVKDVIIAQGKAMIWANIYRVLKAFFKTTTNRELAEGMKILFKARVEFHEVYGLSLHITDIDPSYTVGDLAVKKNIIIKRLREEGVFDMNRETQMPMVPQRVAVISSETAAGYNDFVTHLEENPEGYYFYLTFFPAVMQGPKSEDSIISAFERIYSNANNFDAVAIIRGGGSQTDLSCFDSYSLACHIAQFPLPVVTGIGHEQDDSVTDMVAHTRLKTPTAVAEFFIEQLNSFDEKVSNYLDWTVSTSYDIVNEQSLKLNNYVSALPFNIQSIIHENRDRVNRYMLLLNRNLEKLINRSNREIFIHQAKAEAAISKIFYLHGTHLDTVLNETRSKSNAVVNQQKRYLQNISSIAEIANPESTLRRGFSITKVKNRVVSDAAAIAINDEIETIVYKGSIKSKVIEKSNQ